MTQIIEQADLHYREGGSDKVYHCALQESNRGCEVIFAYGRAGSTLNRGNKTNSPVPVEAARKIYEKLINEKLGKGYAPSPGISGDVFGAGTASGGLPVHKAIDLSGRPEASGHLPQLLNPITEEEAASYIESDEWGAQEKFNGVRLAVKRSERGIEGINRKGRYVQVAPSIASDAATLDCSSFLIDGEAIGNILYAFDILELNGKDLRGLGYAERHRVLSKLVGMDMKHISAVPLGRFRQGKEWLWEDIRRRGGEGVVFKLLDAKYSPGRPSRAGDQLKCKYWESATCLVFRINGDRRSVQIAATSGDEDIPVGNVTIPVNHPIPSEGVLVEIRYLYYFSGGSLYQPQYLGVREDADRSDCCISKLKAYSNTYEDKEAQA